MVLSKDELLKALGQEVHLLLHLISKVDPAKLDYRPSPQQRSLLELLQYLAILGPIHARGALADAWSMQAWRDTWNTQEAVARAMDLDAARDAIRKQSALYAELLAPVSDDALRQEFQMFGGRASRGMWLVQLVLCHYAAYRMQVFLYLKASGRAELNTMNLWAGMDGPMPAQTTR
jgi:hypothetical protein